MHSTEYATWYDTVGLFCCDDVFNSSLGLTVTEWKFLNGDYAGNYKLDMFKTRSFFEGTGTKEEELFLHPARACYSELQCCPYPYFQNKPTWTWDFEVGEHWGAGPLFPIKGIGKFHIMYKWLKGTKTFETPMGRLECVAVDAVSESEFGISRATYYLHEEYGLVHFTVSALGKEQFEFTLLKKIDGREGIAKIYPHFAYGRPAFDIAPHLKASDQDK